MQVQTLGDYEAARQAQAQADSPAAPTAAPENTQGDARKARFRGALQGLAKSQRSSPPPLIQLGDVGTPGQKPVDFMA
mgnify:FL=1|tara:strand:- start:717 stop:950 length:234 start_codon:yes stop_codon:yes gene_type:complete